MRWMTRTATGRTATRPRGRAMTGAGRQVIAAVALVMVVAVVGEGVDVGGAVGDATCDVEDVERANEAQLHSILSELTNTTYFRLFQVDLKRTCTFWRPGGGGGGDRVVRGAGGGGERRARDARAVGDAFDDEGERWGREEDHVLA